MRPTDQHSRDLSSSVVPLADGAPAIVNSGSTFEEASSQRKAKAPSAAPDRLRPYFEVYLADEVRLTSTRLSGGDWCWRLCAAPGVVIAGSGGYDSEVACKSAVSALRRAAQSATILTVDDDHMGHRATTYRDSNS